MKHERLSLAILDAVADELKGLLGPLVASEFARQRAGGDPNAPPALPPPVRSPDRLKIQTCVEWCASTQLRVLRMLTVATNDACRTRIAELVRDALLAQSLADGSAQRAFAEYRADALRIPAEHAARRATIAHVENLPLCQEEARARQALAGLVASMRVKNAQRARRGRAA